MKDRMQTINDELIDIQKRILVMRMEVPIENSASHNFLRYTEQAVSNAVDYAKSAVSSLERECPTLMQIVDQSECSTQY